MSQRPFEYVSKGEQLCQQQKLREAERAFEQAIHAYENDNDTDGVAYALGRMGSCYESSGETNKAVATYRRAVSLGTDIPAIYHGFIGLLVDEGSLDEAFAVANTWQTYGQRHISGSAHQIFVGLGAGLTREKRYEEAITLLSRTIEEIAVQDFPNEHWDAKGRLGYAYEKSGNVDVAVDIFATAIKNGSNNRQSYARYLMYLETQKQYEEALRIIQKGLKLQNDAAWEADLRKRQQRIERKMGKVSNETPFKIIPAFSIRHGKRAVSLLHQIEFSPQITNLAVWSDVAFISTGGKSPKLSAWKLGDAIMDWQVDLPEAVSGIVVTTQTIMTFTQIGRIGEGETILRFFDHVGNEITNERLPDVPSEIVTSNDVVYAGCRDGKLYAFSAQGTPLWSYQVPGSKALQNSDYMRPSPYYVCASPNYVVFSSFSDVFALNNRGKLRWRWSVPEKKSASRSGKIIMTMSYGPALVRGLALASGKDRVVVTAGDTVYEVVDGELNSQVKRSSKNLGRVVLDSTGKIWVFTADDQVLVLDNRKAAGSFVAPSHAWLSLNSNADRIIAWSGKELSIANFAGKAIARLEFVKRISQAYCADNEKIVVGAGHLVVLDVMTQPVVQETDSREKTTIQTVMPVSRHDEEQGIPVRWIEGEKLDTGRGKALYKNRNNQQVTIEQFAIEQYSQAGYTGDWTENEYWWAIMALLFWDVIFASLPDVFSPEFGEFPNVMQDMPRDFFTPEFYPRRKTLIEKRISELTHSRLFGLRKPNIETELRNSFLHHKGKPCRPIDWNKLVSANELIVATRVLSGEQLMKIMHRLLENFSENRKGLPDLFLSKGDVPLFVEVKSEKENLAEHQKQWLLFLKNQVRISVEICRVVPT